VINRSAFLEVRARLAPPLRNQVYAFVPPPAQGGTNDTATVEVAELRDYLSLLHRLH